MADDGGLATRIVTVGVPGAQAFVPTRAVLSSRVSQPNAQSAPILDLFAVLRTLEAARTDLPRLGRALRPSQESVRLGQEPSMAFAGAAVASVAGGAEAQEAVERKAHGAAPSKMAESITRGTSATLEIW